MPSSYQSDFINNFGGLAQDISDKTGLDPSLVLGQIAHESNWGRTVHGNNILGITPGGKLSSYDSVPQAAQAYVDLINRRYSGAAQKQGIDGQAQSLSSSGYGPNNGYGGLIANVARTVQAAGYKPQANSGAPDNDPLVSRGQQLIQQMTGQPAPPMPTAKTQQTDVDVSSDPMVDRGEELVKSMSGFDPTNPDKSAEMDSTGAQQPAGATAPSADPNAPSAMQGVLPGAAHGMSSVLSPIVAWGQKNIPGVAAIDSAIPALGKLDQTYSPDPQAEQSYQQKYGNNIGAQVGNFAGQTLATLPATVPVGIAGGLAAGAVGLPAGVAALGVGAAQGGLAAGLTGGDVKQGAIAGTLLGGLGGAANGINSSIAKGGVIGNAINSKLTDAIVDKIGKGAGAYFGGLPGYLVGGELSGLAKQLTAKYGFAGAAKILQGLNTSGATGSVAGAAPNPLAPAQ